MYILESSDPYKYAVTTSINCIDRRFCTAREIKYRNVIPPMTGEYVSLKSMSGLYVNPCATSLALCLTTSLFLFQFWTKPHLNPTGNTCGGVGITCENTYLFVSEDISAWIASFHWFQSKRVLHSAMVFGSRSFSRILAIIAKKYELTIVVFLSNDSPVSA